MYEDNVRTGPDFVVMDVMMSWSKEILPIVCFFISGACSTAMGYAAALLRHDGWMDDTQGSTALFINTCDDLEAPFLEFPCRKAPRNPTTPPIRCCWCRLSGSDLPSLFLSNDRKISRSSVNCSSSSFTAGCLHNSFPLHSDVRSKTQLAYRWRMCEQLLDVSDDTEDEEENREYIEEANADTVMFALLKLVATDTVAKEHLAPEIISHLEKYGASVGEIVKHLLTGLKKKGDVSNILVEALKRAYQRYLAATSSGNDEESSKKFQECKDLAARLSGSYVGVARNKYKSEILNVVREGINYAFSDAPKQLSFLEGAVLYFVSKLPASDILDIIKGVERRTENLKTDEDPSGWRAYYTFVDTLREKYLKNEVPKVADGKEGTTVRRRGRPRKQQNLPGKRLFDEQSSSEEEDSISGSDQDAGVDEKQEDDEEDAPLIHSLRASSKLRSLRISKEDKRSHTKTVDGGRAPEELATPKTSGASS